MAFKFKFKNYRQKKKKKGASRVIPIDVVQQMFDLYCRELSIASIAEDCGVSKSTVTRYINEGDSSRNIEPFKLRRARIVEAAMGVQDGRVMQRFYGIQTAASRSLANATARYLERIEAARKLDDSTLWADPDNPERIALEYAALNPTAHDVVHLLDRNTALVDMSLRMSGLLPEESKSPTVQVNVNAHSQTDVRTMDAVFEYIDNAAKRPDNDKAVVDIVREESLLRESDGVGEGK